MGATQKIKSTPAIDYTIYTDASNLGWGADDGETTINGRWSDIEHSLHINCQELLAVKLAIASFLPLREETKHVRIMSDNSTTISYINKMGGTKSESCHNIAVDIWEICIKHGTHISAAHIPGVHNVVADAASRKFQDAAEWMLSPDIFGKLITLHGCPEIDLFATRLNKQLETYVSWLPDPSSTYIDAMSISSENKFIYLFPPFSMIWPIITKMEQDRVPKALLIAPLWSTQSWFPRLMEMLISEPLIISSKHLLLPGSQQIHPLAPKLKLLGVLCTGDQERASCYRTQSRSSSVSLPGTTRRPSTVASQKGGWSTVVKGSKIIGRELHLCSSTS